MKRSHFILSKVIALTALFAIGEAGLRGANLAGLTEPETTKRWTVSLLTGVFYDDNNLNTSTNQLAGWGLEVRPQIAFNLPLERTLLRLAYDLRLDYYDTRPVNPIDTEHQFEGRLNHRITERSTVNVSETFISATQPEVHGTQGGAQTTFQQGDRGDSSHWRNYFRTDYSLRLAPTYGLAGGYDSFVYDYQQQGVGNFSALLDRVQNQAHVEGQLFPSAQSRLYGGYQISAVNYTSGDPLAFKTGSTNGPLPVPILPSVRDSLSHYFYVGGDRRFNPQLSGSLSVGATLTDYQHQSVLEWAPFLDLSATVLYAPRSSIRLSAKVDRNATDSGVGDKGVTRDQLSSLLDLSVRHHFAARLDGTLSVTYQHSVYNGGNFDGLADDSYYIVPGVEYMIMRNLYASLTYTRIELVSSRPELSFVRNRVLLGVRVTY